MCVPRYLVHSLGVAVYMHYSVDKCVFLYIVSNHTQYCILPDEFGFNMLYVLFEGQLIIDQNSKILSIFLHFNGTSIYDNVNSFGLFTFATK